MIVKKHTDDNFSANSKEKYKFLRQNLSHLQTL